MKSILTKSLRKSRPMARLAASFSAGKPKVSLVPPSYNHVAELFTNPEVI